MEECKSCKIPIDKAPNVASVDDEIIIGKKPYRELVGCLMYAMIATRPDLCWSVNYYSRFQKDAKEVHWNGLKRVLRYIKGTLNLGLRYVKNNNSPLVAFSDADWGGDRIDGKSTTGGLIQIYGNTAHWITKKQSSVALSSTEAEYVA